MKKTLIIIAIVLLLGGLAALGYLYYDARKDVSDLRAEISNANQQLEDFKSNPELAAEAEVDRYIEEVGKLYALPSDERPSVATVNDKEKLEDQPFFENAENGDVTLIYAESKLAVLYRPSTKQLVNVSSVTIDPDAKD